MSQLRVILAVLVATVWATGYILNYVNPTIYHPPSEVTPLMLIVVGGLMGREAVAVWKRTNGH